MHRAEPRLWNGDSYKGYEYSLSPPMGLRKASLDDYGISQDDNNRFGDHYMYKPIRGNWYLYLLVNRQ